MSDAQKGAPGWWCIVPAAGSGQRFGGATPKQYADLMGQPMLLVTLGRLLRHPQIAGAVVALAADDAHWPGIDRLCDKPLRTVIGGASRAESVKRALAALPGSVAAEDLVVIHDAARPLLAPGDLTRVLERAAQHPVGAVLGVRLADTLKRVASDGEILRTEDRENLCRAQTPQVIRRKHLENACRALDQAGHGALNAATDDSNMLEVIGLSCCFIDSQSFNDKVTTEADLALARRLLAPEMDRPELTPQNWTPRRSLNEA